MFSKESEKFMSPKALIKQSFNLNVIRPGMLIIFDVVADEVRRGFITSVTFDLLEITYYSQTKARAAVVTYDAAEVLALENVEIF